ncbi:hypothetical protein TTHERM_00301930 (macronuclear) [Tetrahymena thermophila SB210]|uniref:Uncharacterized protein n=1 Tax=Tetrahymena thermophila (strain SB210) TaxID=312017 RepID=I7M3V6_TETTS|nr:hypothetical protein TTHERM_00301930 [Tetrahymena thermophila SB210]EAS04376.1 hypothetical protein TTHERM_00301930 [Tetrahymena thermophila SB210]|eukprot:XP_001024621.1 hypothetical protein TTHERM_00301930 [Tetrahymena thermophila SB210]
MQLARQININQGIQKFNGDEKQYTNMLLTFDKITVDDSLSKIYISIQREQQNIKQTVREVLNLQQSADTVSAVGLSQCCREFITQINQLQDVKDLFFRSLILLDQFIEKVLEFKDELKRVSQRDYFDNTQIAKGIQHDIRLTIISMNEEQNQLHQSRMVQYSQNFYLNNSYSQLGANQLLSQQQTIEQQNQNYSYFMNLNREKEQIKNNIQMEAKSLNASRVLYPENNVSQSIRVIPNQIQYEEGYSDQQIYSTPQRRRLLQNFNNDGQIVEDHGEQEDCKCYIF